MKTTTLLSLPLILFAFSANSAPSPVLDITGKTIRVGVDCYIMLAARDGNSGGITLHAARPNNTCPLGVALSRAHEPGLPLTFTSVNPKEGVIRLSTDVNIKFSGSPSCHQSNVWKLGYDESTKQYVVMVGGVAGNPGRETVDNWFKIEKTKDGYKLVFCPTVCNFCKVMCRDVGIYVDDQGTRRLALSDVPLAVIFQR